MRVSLPIATAIAGLIFTAPIQAAIEIATSVSGPNNPSTTTDETAFAEFVSNSDLLHGLVGTGGAWNASGSSPTGLNDGNPGGDFDAIGIAALGGKAWALDGDGVSFREFHLGLGDGSGYDISEIRSIASWQGAGFPNQKYRVSVRFVGDEIFIPVTTVDYQPFPAQPANNGGSTMASVTNADGILVGGVEAIRFDILDTVSDNGGGAVFAEIDVFGSPSGADDSPPAIGILSPADDATGVSTSTDLVATFNDLIVPGSGHITIRRSDDGSVVESFDVQDSARLNFSGVTLAIDPSDDLDAGVAYSVEIDATAIVDDAGNSFGGFLDPSSWNFTTSSLVSEQTFSLTQYAYAADASATDLLHGLIPITSGWNTSNEASPLELTDGVHGVGLAEVPGDRVQGAWTTSGASAEYSLGLSSQGSGYDIISIQSIADWVDARFGNQGWTVEVKRVDGSYTTLASVDYQPLTVGGTTKVTLSDANGALARGVDSIKFTANQVNGGANGGAFVWRELDVFGVPSGADETPPRAVAFTPADNATEVSPTNQLLITFDEPITLGTGNLTIKNLTSSSQTTISVASSEISASGAVLTIDPNENLDANAEHAIWIDSTAILDAVGNAYAGISNDTEWNFTTGEIDLTGPEISALAPADDAVDVPVDANLTVTFNENIVSGTGNLTIKNLDASTETTIPINSSGISISGKQLTINPASNLAGSAHHSIQIDPEALKDSSGNSFAGISDDTTWNFVTAAAPLRIMPLGDSITVGYTDNPSWANHPFQFGYRSGLYSRLMDANSHFKFVGTSPEPWSGLSGDPTHGGTYTPTLDLRTHGQDGHRGFGGASIAAITSEVAGYIATDQPDVILLMIGINGISEASPAALDTLVNAIVTAAPDVHLIVAQITPLAEFNQHLYNYNLYIRDTLVPAYAENGFNVSTVDLYSLFLTDPTQYSSAIAPGVLSNGINHPDQLHYDLMAQRWLEGIEALGLQNDTYGSWIDHFPAIAGRTGFDDDPDRDGISNGLENFFGTAPDASSTGISAVSTSGDAFVFTHPQNPSPASDLSASYRWSKDLASFHGDGETDAEGTKVDFSTHTNTPTPNLTTVTANLSGPNPGKIFVRVTATQVP